MRKPTVLSGHRVSSPRRARSVVLLGAAATAAMAISVIAAGGSAEASVGSDPFVAGQVYHGDFADPSLMMIGDRYYAFATTTGGDHIPSMTSTNLSTWRARKAYPMRTGIGSWKGYNDALPQAASYSATHMRGGKEVTSAWSPSVAKVGGHYVMAYVVQVRNTPVRRCISLATSNRPLGQYVDKSTKPIVCSSDPRGSVDPQVFVTPAGRAYLVWKNTGLPGHHPTKIWTRRLNAKGTAFKSGTRAHHLLSTREAWEGTVIENPAMVKYHGHFYLFYSGNKFSTSKYATGYAICKTATSGCHRVSNQPLLASGDGVAGPGGAVPLVDASGTLRLGYAAWSTDHVGYPTTTACRQTAAGCNQRRLYVATLAVRANGHLRVVDRG